MKKLDYDFFARPTETVARDLLGKIMFFESPEGVLAGRIIETEAYLGKDDPGSHSCTGKTKRNEAMFGSAGRHYVYLIYGIHYCYNITTDQEQVPAAVLIRALEPLKGIDIMQENRPKSKIERLCAGPGNLCRALGINMDLNDKEAVAKNSKLYYIDDGFEVDKIKKSLRIGVPKEKNLPLRFFISGHASVSGN